MPRALTLLTRSIKTVAPFCEDRFRDLKGAGQCDGPKNYVHFRRLVKKKNYIFDRFTLTHYEL